MLLGHAISHAFDFMHTRMHESIICLHAFDFSLPHSPKQTRFLEHTLSQPPSPNTLSHSTIPRTHLLTATPRRPLFPTEPFPEHIWNRV